MAYSCCSGAFSSCSLRPWLPSSGSPCGSSYPSKLVYTTTSCSPSTCQVESSLNTGCQKTCIEPTSCQRSCVVSRPCQVESSVNTGCQETCIEPTSCQRSCVVSRPCQVESSVNTGCQETCIEPTSGQRSCMVSRPCQVDSSLNTGCQETCIVPSSCQRSCVVFRPCQTACYYLRSSTPCSPCPGSYAGSLCFWCSSCQSLGYRSRSCYTRGCGCSGFRSMTYRFYDFPSLSDGSRICYPTYSTGSSCHPCC